MSQFQKQLRKEKNRILDKQSLIQQEITQQYQASIIQKFNVIQVGINFLVPHIWYQELCHLNFKIKQFQNLTLPPFSIKSILLIYGLIQQQASCSNHLQKISEQFSSILSNTNFINIEVYKGIKISKLCENHQEFSWKVVNPYLWRIIQQKKQQINNQSIYSLPIYIQEEFIKANKSQIVRGPKKQRGENFSTILFRNKFYQLKENIFNKYIMQELFNTRKKLVELVLIQNKKKVQFNAYFDVKLKIKSLILSLKKIFNFSEETFKVYKRSFIKEQITRLTTFQILGQNSTLLILFPNLQILREKFQLTNLSFQNYLKSNIVQKAYLKIDKIKYQNSNTTQNRNNMHMPLVQLNNSFKVIKKQVLKNRSNSVIKESQVFLKECLKKKISFAQSKHHHKKSFQTQQQAILNQSDGSGQNSRNIRSISTYECTPNQSWHEQINSCNQYRKIVKDRIKRKRNKIINLQRNIKKEILQHSLFKQVSHQEQKYFRLIAKQSIFNQKDLIHISKPKQDEQSYFRSQLQKLIQFFQKTLQATQLSKDLSQQINLQKEQMQKLSRQKMKEEQIITIVDNQLQMDLQRDIKGKQKYYFDKEQQLNEKKKIKRSVGHRLPSSRKSQKIEREDQRISIQTQTEQVQFYSDEQHMLDQDEQVI